MPADAMFNPSEYRELSDQEIRLLQTAYDKATDALHRNITPMGFSACSLEDNTIYGTDENYRSVWARDGALTTLWTLDLDDEALRRCQVATLETLLEHQADNGQIPANVRIDSGEPDYSGVGGIASIDSVLWTVIACNRYAVATGDWAFIERHKPKLDRAMRWLEAHDSNQCGLLEIPEASDWADLFGYSFHVLYDEVLWHRSLVCYAQILRQLGDTSSAEVYDAKSVDVSAKIISTFWPTTVAEDGGEQAFNFAQTQYTLGNSRYLVAQVSPFSFSWRCDVYANILAYLTNMVDRERAMMTFRFLWGVGVNAPGPVQNLYPPVQSGDPEWRSYYTVNLLNLPGHYHNGGIWPFIGGMWVRYIHKLGMADLARRELVHLAELCRQGTERDWEFNEWHHATTGRPMGKAYQAWTAASFLRACHDLRLDPDSTSDTI